MKIQVLSDLHRELYRALLEPMDFPWELAPEADVIVLAGDIDDGLEAVSWLAGEAKRQNRPIVYVPGNHEYYAGVLEERLAQMRQLAEGTGVHLLDGDEVVIDGVRFLGTTLWTDYRASLSTAIPDLTMAMFHCGRLINDHREISVRDEHGQIRPFTPQDALDRHIRARAWLTQRLEQAHSGPTVVVTHHGPSAQAQHPRFSMGKFSGAYWSDLSSLFEHADLWIYGHTHAAIDTTVGTMRLVANQGGYPHAPGRGFERIKLLELE